MNTEYGRDDEVSVKNESIVQDPDESAIALGHELEAIAQHTRDAASQGDPKADHEHAKLKSLLDKYPEESQQVITTESGFDVRFCGTEQNPEHARIIERAMKGLEARFGKEVIKKVFRGLQTYVVADVGVVGGGQALPREGVVILSAQHMGMRVSDMEELASQSGMYRIGDQSEVFGSQADASEIGYVHELGHILEYRAHGDMGLGFASLDHTAAPTWYGQARGSHEDYAESWMFLAYGHDEKISEERRAILQNDLTRVAERMS